jgi:crotonobetainyl-CoA:carnitine CoA-transferase CaiB-like acyl-CoA transferase
MGHLGHIVRRPGGEVFGAGTLDRDQLGTGPLERLYRTADGWVCVVVPGDPTFEAFCAALGCDDLASDDRFVGSDARRRHADELAAILERHASKLATADLVAALAAADVPHAVPVPYNCEAFLADPEHRRTGRSVESPHATRGHVREVAKLVRISDAAVAPHRPAPELGEHTDEVLAQAGYDEAEIADLRARGVVR